MFVVLSRRMEARIVRIPYADEMKQAADASAYVNKNLMDEVPEKVLGTLELPEDSSEVKVIRAIAEVSGQDFGVWLEDFLTEVANLAINTTSGDMQRDVKSAI